MASVKVDHVSKRFGDAQAVHDFSVEVDDGEILVLVGPSGCGKTTVLRMIAGLEVPDSGEILFDGQVVTHVPPRERDVAMVFEDYALYPHMDVADNLAFPLRMRKTPAEAIRQRVSEVAHTMELDPLLERKPTHLATGEAQNVAVGHAVVREAPAVLLLDDAFSHLDAHQRQEARAELGRLHRELRATIVAVTHDQSEAIGLGMHVAVMNEGVLRQAGPPIELYERPADTFVAGFIGSPAMNLLEMTMEQAAGASMLRRGPLVLALSPRPAEIGDLPDGAVVIVGFRPVHIDIGRASAAGEVMFSGTCEHIEYLGHHVLLHLLVADVAVVASVDPAHEVRVGDDVDCCVPLSELRFFDGETGSAIGSPRGSRTPATA